MGIGGSGADLMYRLMEASTLRSKVIAGNIANQNTPGYTRRTVRFEDDLREALSKGEEIRGMAPEITQDRLSPARPDGNNVTLEVELNSMRENRMLFDTYATIVQGHFELIRTSIQDGN